MVLEKKLNITHQIEFSEIEEKISKQKAKEFIEIIKKYPFKNPPPYEKLVGNLNGSYSRRIHIQHRLVYEVREDEKKVRISRMWSPYGE